MTTVDAQAYLVRLLEDIATAPAIGTGSRRELLVDALAPLGAAAAGRQADEIEKHAYWVRNADSQATGTDVAFAASVEQAASLTSRALADADADGM